MNRIGQPADACLNPWLRFELPAGDAILFGYASKHPVTGGLSWMHSSRLRQVDEKAGRARTASGRLYALDQRIAVDQLDEEGHAAFELLILTQLSHQPQEYSYRTRQ